MKRWVSIVAICTVFAPSAVSAAGRVDETSLSLDLTWTLGTRIGAEHRYDRFLGLKGAAGTSVLFDIAQGEFYLGYEAEIVVYLRDHVKALQVNILLGVVDGYLVFADDAHMHTMGAALELGWRAAESMDMSVKLGAGHPLVFEHGEFRHGSNFAFGLMPSLALGFDLYLCPR